MPPLHSPSPNPNPNPSPSPSPSPNQDELAARDATVSQLQEVIGQLWFLFITPG